MPSIEKPREKAIHFGIETLSNAELIAIILRTGDSTTSVLDLSYKILEQFNGLEGLKNVSYQQLSSLKGLKEAKAISLLSVIEISKRINYQKSTKILVNSCDKVYELLEPYYSNEQQEKLVVLFLNRKCLLINKKEIFVGGLDTHLIHPRDIFREAVKVNSASIILVHNHPSGDPTPSAEDIENTKVLDKLGRAMGIKVLDHIIIGKGEYYSLKTNKLY